MAAGTITTLASSARGVGARGRQPYFVEQEINFAAAVTAKGSALEPRAAGRAGDLRRLYGDLERDAGAAHAADERDERDLEHHRHRCTAAAQLRRQGHYVDRRRHRRHHGDQYLRRFRGNAPHARNVQEVRPL